MTLEELNKRIERRELKTRGGFVVRKIELVRRLSGEEMYEVYVEGMPWCLVTVDANTGLYHDDGRLDDDDLIY